MHVKHKTVIASEVESVNDEGKHRNCLIAATCSVWSANTKQTKCLFRRLRGNFGLLGYNAVYSFRWLPTFWGNLLPITAYKTTWRRRPQPKFTPPRKPQFSNCHMHTLEIQRALILMVIQILRSETTSVGLFIENVHKVMYEEFATGN